MRIAWFSNSPHTGTGYGAQTALMLPRLVERYGARNVAMLSNFGTSGGPLGMNGVTHYPTGYTAYSDDVACTHARHHFADQQGVMFTLFDVWPLKSPEWAELPFVASWVPIDHAPVPPDVLAFFKRTGALPIAMSRFGERWLKRAGLDPMYAPHAIDRTVMRPTLTINGKPARQAFGIPEHAYVVGMVAANKGVLPNRKSFPQAFQAFSEFRTAHPELDAVLYVHTDPTGATGGVDLYRLARAMGLRPGEHVLFTDPYASRMPLPAASVAGLYSAFDVLLMPSMGEGFGVPAIEAQACGVPVIGSDFSAQPEVIEAGWVVNGEPYYDLAQDSWLVTPNVTSIVAALAECAARTLEQVATDSAKAQAHADTYEVDHVWRTYWEPVLEAIENRLPSIKPIAAKPVRGVAA